MDHGVGMGPMFQPISHMLVNKHRKVLIKHLRKNITLKNGCCNA